MVNIRIIKWSNVLTTIKHDKFMLKAFEDFRRRLKFADQCKNPQDLIKHFQHSDLITCPKLKQSRIVFNIGSNKYRLICGSIFKNEKAILFVKFVGTHQAYDKIDPCTINMFEK